MPSRKQRRRRAKERRHEYEYVYVDETGREIEPPPEDEPERRRWRGKSNANGAKTKSGKPTGPLRQAKPPSWNRSFRRALLFLPLFFIVFSLVNDRRSSGSNIHSVPGPASTASLPASTRAMPSTTSTKACSLT